MSFFLERISKRIWKIVESDPYGQFPFIYVIIAIDKIIVVDTGTGKSNLKQYIDENLNPSGLPYVLLLTHVHFDHVGGVGHFLNKPDVLDICMGSKNKVFSQNIEINSLAAAHHGCSCKHFEVTRWLQEGDLIYMDEQDKTKQKSLEVIFIPGHTPDSVGFCYRFGERRLFIGDLIYPFTAIHLDCIGSNPGDFVYSLNRLNQVVGLLKQENLVTDDLPVKGENAASHAPTPPSAAEVKSKEGGPYDEMIFEFTSVLGLNIDTLSNQFDIEKLIELSDFSVENAINLYLTNGDQISALCPPKQKKSASKPSPPTESPFLQPYTLSNEVQLSCGHVEANLPTSSISDLATLMQAISSKTTLPQHIDGNYGEYSFNNYTLILPLNSKWS